MGCHLSPVQLQPVQAIARAFYPYTWSLIIKHKMDATFSTSLFINKQIQGNLGKELEGLILFRHRQKMKRPLRLNSKGANLVVYWNMQSGIMWQETIGKDIMPDVVYMYQLWSRITMGTIIQILKFMMMRRFKVICLLKMVERTVNLFQSMQHVLMRQQKSYKSFDRGKRTQGKQWRLGWWVVQKFTVLVIL